MNLKVVGANQSIKDQLLIVCKDLGLKLDFVDFADKCQNQAKLIVLQKNFLNEINDVLMENETSYLLVFEDRKDLECLKKLKIESRHFFGFIDLSLDEFYNQPILNNFASMKLGFENSNLEKLSKDLDKILNFSEEEVLRVKKLHDQLVKMRTEKIKGGNLYLKFMAGEKSGGEFFDYTGNENEMLMIQVGSQSYLTSSLMLNVIEEFKIKNKLDEESIIGLTKNLLKIGEENGSKINYMITLFNFHRLEINYFQRGQSKLFQGDSLLNIEGNGKMRLKPGNRLFFISEGYLKNLLMNMKESDFQLLFQKNVNLEIKDLINELFFQVHKNKKGTFLEYDALICAIEIEAKAIFEV